MKLDMKKISDEYTAAKGYREAGKWIFSILTFGLGALYLWATTIVIPEGEIGLRKSAKGKMTLLPPGRHSNFPWEGYPVDPQSLSDKEIKMGPYKIITADTGWIAETYNKGVLDILDAGQHLLTEASHTFARCISIKEETKKLHSITAATQDNVSLEMLADVRYQIINPGLAVSKIADIETSIKEIAEINIALTVSHHSLDELSPAMSLAVSAERGLSAILKEIDGALKAQLASIGIKLISIGIKSRHFLDEALAHELGQGAVIKSQTQSKLLAAENAARVRGIEAAAEANAILVQAEAKAAAIKMEGNAYAAVVQGFDGDPMKKEIYTTALQAEMTKHAANANLFFSAGRQDPLQTMVAIPAVAANQ